MTKLTYIFLFGLLVIGFNFCSDSNITHSLEKKVNDSIVYLNHSDSAHYVGMNTCKLCHQSIYNTFIKTGMGKSFEVANKTKSSADFSNSSIYDKIKDLHYKAFWNKDSLFFNEFRLNKNDTIHSRTEQVNYIIGSGQHTNSHLQSVNGYVNQMPMTYYTQKKQWDLPPGFENGLNTRFSRKIGLECMSCHNGYPNFVMGSENKYTSLPSGIDCERCHGPGSIHVAQQQSGNKIDTSKYIDFSIVNPAKLSIDAQFDICQRCHLQGNAVLKEGKSFYDFKPGQQLSNYISVFLPKYKNADDEFIMASHADRLKQSACFIKSMEKLSKVVEALETTRKKNVDSRTSVTNNQTSATKLIKPYKEAITCVTCHNPHVSVRETNKNVFNDACTNCHNQPATLKTAHSKFSNWNNCVSCHMPVSGSIDIPHVSVHDHYIRKPITQKEKNKIKTFVGLYSVNEKNPDALTKAKAYINQYDKFEQNAIYLDSAILLLNDKSQQQKNSCALIQLYFIKQNFKEIVTLVNALGEQNCFNNLFTQKSYENTHAWACYRIAEAYYYLGNKQNSVKWFNKAVTLAPFNLDFRNKYGTALAETNNLDKAIQQFEFIMNENPKFVSAYSNLGYIKLVKGFTAEAMRLYTLGEKLDPDNEALLLNLAAYYLFLKDNQMAKKYLIRILKVNPNNQKAKMAFKQIKY